MHIADRALGHLGANAIVGGGIPHVVGAGITFRNRGTGQVAVAFFGDGAMGQGVLYEAMNMAALWSLPVVFCCLNNRYGMGTRVDRANARAEFPARADAFGLRAARCPGEDVEATHAAAQDILGAARDGKPGFLEIDAYRFHGHARMDKSPYRTPEEEAEGRARDPLVTARRRLTADGLEDALELDRIDAEAAAEMDAALEAAVAAPVPAAPTLFEDVFAPGTPAPRPQRDRLRAILGEAR